MVAYRMQTDPTIRRLRSVISDGALGDPVTVQSHMSQPLPEFFGVDDWRLDPSMAGRGCSVSDLGVYPINTTRFLLDTDPDSVVANGRSDRDGLPRLDAAV